MMKRYLFLFALIVGLGMVFSINNVLSAPPESVVIKEIQKAQPPVTFNHKKHSDELKINCIECHHTAKPEDVKAGTAEKCSKCHTDKAEGKKVVLKEAFHKKCVDCHKKEKAGGKKTPTICNECHKK